MRLLLPAVLLALLASVLTPPSAQAESDWLTHSLPVCLARSWSSGHLADHPHQAVASLTVLLAVAPTRADGAPAPIRAAVQATFRDDPRARRQILTCTPGPDRLSCQVACEGGQLTLRPRAPGASTAGDLQVLETDGFAVGSHCGTADEALLGAGPVETLESPGARVVRYVMDQGDPLRTPTTLRLRASTLGQCWRPSDWPG